MKQTISGTIDIENIKRCYAKDAVIKVKCPICKNTLETDLGANYLSYPVIGKEDTFYFYCEKCEEAGNDPDYELPIKVISAVITLEYNPDAIYKA